MVFENKIFDHTILASQEKKVIESSIEVRIKIEGECTELDLKLLGEVQQSSTIRNHVKDHIVLHFLLIFEAQEKIVFFLEIRKVYVF